MFWYAGYKCTLLIPSTKRSIQRFFTATDTCLLEGFRKKLCRKSRIQCTVNTIPTQIPAGILPFRSESLQTVGVKIVEQLESGLLAHACHPSSGRLRQEDQSSNPAWATYWDSASKQKIKIKKGWGGSTVQKPRVQSQVPLKKKKKNTQKTGWTKTLNTEFICCAKQVIFWTSKWQTNGNLSPKNEKEYETGFA